MNMSKTIANRRISVDLHTKLRFDTFVSKLQNLNQKMFTQSEALNELLNFGEDCIKIELKKRVVKKHE